jgi:hypothetical protein
MRAKIRADLFAFKTVAFSPSRESQADGFSVLPRATPDDEDKTTFKTRDNRTWERMQDDGEK